MSKKHQWCWSSCLTFCSAHTWSVWIQCYFCWIRSFWCRSYIWWNCFIRWRRYIWQSWFICWKSHIWLSWILWQRCYRCYRCCSWFLWWNYYSVIWRFIISLWSCKHFHMLLDIFQKALFPEYLSTAKSLSPCVNSSQAEGVSSRCLWLNTGSRFVASWDILVSGQYSVVCERGGSLVPTGYLLLHHLSGQCRTVKSSFGSAQGKQTNQEPPPLSLWWFVIPAGEI